MQVSLNFELLEPSLCTGEIILIGEPYWRQLPLTEDVAKGCLANSISDFLMLPELLASSATGYSVATIQALLRHKSAGTTERYLRTLGLEHIRDAVEGLSAMGNMSTSGDERRECRP